MCNVPCNLFLSCNKYFSFAFFSFFSRIAKHKSAVIIINNNSVNIIIIINVYVILMIIIIIINNIYIMLIIIIIITNIYVILIMIIIIIYLYSIDNNGVRRGTELPFFEVGFWFISRERWSGTGCRQMTSSTS